MRVNIDELVGLLSESDKTELEVLRQRWPDAKDIFRLGEQLGDQDHVDAHFDAHFDAAKRVLKVIIKLSVEKGAKLRPALRRARWMSFASTSVTTLSGLTIWGVLFGPAAEASKFFIAAASASAVVLSIAAQFVSLPKVPGGPGLIEQYAQFVEFEVEAARLSYELLSAPKASMPALISTTNDLAGRFRKALRY